jgi:hypothetical protein
MLPEITIVWADTAYARKLIDWAEQHLNPTIEPGTRRHEPDHERHIQHAETLIACSTVITLPRQPGSAEGGSVKRAV